MNKLSSPIDLIRRAFQIFFQKENFIYFLRIYAILVPFALFFQFQDVLFGTENFDVENVGSILAGSTAPALLVVIIGLAYTVASFLVGIAGIKAIFEVVGGLKTSTREVFVFAWGKFWLFLLLSILVGLVVGVGFLLLIIPGILFLVWFSFSQFELVVKGAGVTEAMRNSKKLVAGRFWKVLGRILVFGGFGILVQIVFSIIPMNLGSVVLPLFGALLTLPSFLLYQELQTSMSS